jgi:hypothetical protein
MGVNLILATGVACSVGGALFMLASHRAIRNAAALMVAYPRELDRRRVQRQDRRFGFCMMIFGCVLYALAACGFSAPMGLWRYPAVAAIATILVYCIARLATSRRKTNRRRRPASSQKSAMTVLYDTPRSIRLRDAAQLESANLHAMEAARAPRDNGVVYLAREWDRRWWSDRFGVSTDVIKAAMREVGPMSKDIERHLASQSCKREAAKARQGRARRSTAIARGAMRQAPVSDTGPTVPESWTSATLEPSA